MAEVVGAFPGVQIGYLCVVAAGAPSESILRGMWGSGRVPPPPPWVIPDLSGILPKDTDTTPVPGGGVSGGSTNQTNLRVYFLHRHVRDTIVIMEEGSRTYPRCPKYEIFLSYLDINVWHPFMHLCFWG